MSIEDPTAEELFKAGKIDEASNSLWEEFNRAREQETRAINEFEKILWLTNSGAATITIGYITSADSPTSLLFLGSTLFVTGILLLFVMKFVGETNSVRDRVRRQKVSESFFHKGKPMSSFDNIRDKTFKRLAWIYKGLKSVAALCFISGCIVTLIGLLPLIKNS
ncbi:MAG TPA: hypothetical protein VIM41_09830 [Gammaproteobacteria bacterium]